MKKALIIASSVLIPLLLAGFFYFKLSKENGAIQPIYFVPSDAVYVIETDEPTEAWKKIKGNPLWEHLISNQTFSELSGGLTALDEIIQENQLVFDILGSRKVLVSAHMYKRTDYDFLYLIDVETKVEVSFLEEILSKAIDKNDYRLTRRAYGETTILELYDKEFKETLFISAYENIVMASYLTQLVEKSIDEYKDPKLGRNLNFVDVTSRIDDSEYFQVYLNYAKFPEFLNMYLDEPDPTVADIASSLYFSALSFNLGSAGQMELIGTTNVNDTLNTFLNALSKSGNGKRDIANIAPDITAFYMSLGFDSFTELVNNFESSFKKTDSAGFVAYRQNTRKIERFLGINVQKNFYSWIGDEAAYVQLQPGGLGSKNEFAFVLKTNDVTEAKKHLGFIKNRIRKKTPGKFKSVMYKDYEINYLSIKGFFKTLMGKFFAKLERPYYAIIDDYVILSNHPQTLRIIIDHYLEKKVLAEHQDYVDFASGFDAKHNVTCYVHMGRLYDNMLELSDPQTRENIIKNKDYIVCFDQVGFQMMNDDLFFNTYLKTSYKDPKQLDITEKLNFNILTGLNFILDTLPKEENDLFATIDIQLEDFDVDEYVEYYNNEIPKVEVEIKDGVPHGIYKQFYEDGTLMLKGHFESDMKEGTWKFYNNDGKLVEKRQYKDGKVVR